MEEEINYNIKPLSPKTHNLYLDAIKKLLSASFVGWVQEKDKKSLRIVINKKELFLPFEGGEIITEESYKKLITDIINNHNGRETIQEPVYVDGTEKGN